MIRIALVNFVVAFMYGVLDIPDVASS